ncbi:MAG: ATP-binding protein, partial [Candidatus Acidiferrales bacterium]
GLTESWEYVPPATETQHLQPLQDASRHRQTNAAMQARITLALNNPAQSSPAFAVAALTWAKSAAAEPNDGDTDQNWMREEAIVSAAMIAARDGGAEVIAKHDEWIRGTFMRAFKGKNDPVHRMRAGLQFNPIAIAFVGMILLLKNRFAIEDVRTILEVAGDDNPAAAHGFAKAAGVVASIDERLPRAILRCALAACVRPRRDWKEPEATYAAHHRKSVAIAIDAEMAWLTDKTTEPEWPKFPPEPVRSRRRIHLGGGRPEPVERISPPDVYTDHQSAALWVGGASSLFDVANRPWLRDIIHAYMTWTYLANGSELEENDDVEHPPREWNDVYFKLLAWCLPGLTSQQADEIAVAHITSLPDESFCDATTAFLRNVDTVYFNDHGLPEAQAVHIRSELARRLMTTDGWVRHSRDRSRNIELHLGPAIAVLFFNDSGFPQPAKCYLLPKGIDGLNPFLPVLKEMAESGQFLFVALVLLNLLEVSPRTAHLPLANSAAKAWLTSNPGDNTFWVDSDIGRRLCCVMEAIFNVDPKAFGSDQPLRKDIDNLLAALVRLGIPDAHRLEEALRLPQ